ncbi:MAG: class I SAM-dependent methyltransferase [Planctomycetales bacterium]
MSLYSQNRAAWNRLAESASRFARPASDEECRQPLQTLDTRGWLPASVKGMDVLCLASGGGWQSILYAVAGAHVTVVDLSPEMLKLDIREASRRNVGVRVMEASMDKMPDLKDASFDIVHQPVSTCYIPDIGAVYQEVARVLRPGGIYISQHKQPTSLQIVGRDLQDRYILGTGYYHQGPLPPPTDDSYREPGAVEFLHRWDQLVGGLCRCGFVLEDLREPYRGDPQAPPGDYHHRGLATPPYVRLKARRVAETAQDKKSGGLWIPVE